MKSILFALSFLCFTSFGNENRDALTLKKTISAGDMLINYQIVGDQALLLKEALFSHFKVTKSKKYIWKFKHIELPNISSDFTLEVYQGLHGEKESSETCLKGGSYFNTFTSEKYKTYRESQELENEQPGLLIYVKRKRKFGVNCEESVYIENYLKKIYANYLP